MVKVKTYENNLRVIVNEIEYVKSVTVGIMVGAGSCNESADENGISHFIEHMNFKGTNKRNAFEISDHADCIGAQINAFTSKDVTCYYIKSIDEHAEESFEILSDIFLNSIYPEDELDKERNVIIEEINMTEDTPDELCIDTAARAHFGNEGYGATILGPISNAERFNRNHLFAYRKKYYVPANTVISFAGKIKFEDALKMVEKAFIDYKGEGEFIKPTIDVNCLSADLAVDKAIEQAHIALATPSISVLSPDKSAVLCINSVLGGGMSSRLFQSVREKRGLAYSVYSYLSCYKETGVLYVYAGVNPKSVRGAYDCIIDEVSQVGIHGITQNELSRAKEQIKGSTALSSESTSSLMMSYGKRLLISNEIFDVEKELAALSALTLDEVNEVAKKRFTLEKMATALVSKNAKKLRSISELN